MFAPSFWEICMKETAEKRRQADFPCSRGGRTQCRPPGTLTLAVTRYICSQSRTKHRSKEGKQKVMREVKKQMDKLPFSVPELCLICCPSASVLKFFTVVINHNRKKAARPVVFISHYPGRSDSNFSLRLKAEALTQP